MMPNRQQATDRNVMEIGDCNEGIRYLCGNAGVGAGLGSDSLNQCGFVVVPRGPRSVHYYQTSSVVPVFIG